MGLELLEQFGVCRLLVFLLHHPEGVQRARYRDKPLSLSAATAKRDHDALYEAGLIHSVEHKAKLLFALTERGRKVAEQLAEIQRIMAGSDAAPPR